MDRYIYFVGKPYPHNSALQKIEQMGYKLGLFLDKNISLTNLDQFDKVIPLDFTSKTALLADINDREISVDGLLCTYENYIPAKSWLAEHFNLPALSESSAYKCTDKLLMREAFAAHDPLITPRFGLVSTVDQAISLSKTLTYPLILKPTNLVKSLLILRCNNEDELIENFTYANSKIAELYKKYNVYGREPQLIIEEFITGETCSVAAFIDKNGEPHFCDGIVTLTTAQQKGINDSYLYCREIPGSFSAEQTKEIFAVAEKGIRALEMSSTPAHVELIYDNQCAKLIEIGARIGGYRPRMYSFSYGTDLIQQEIALALGEKPDLSGSLRAYTAVFELFPEKEGVFSGVDGVADTSQYAYFALKANPGQVVGPSKKGYKASLIVIVSSPDKITYDSLCRSVENITIHTK